MTTNFSGPVQVTDALIVGGTASFGGAVTFAAGQTLGTAIGNVEATGNVQARAGTIQAGTAPNSISFGTTTPLAGVKGDIVFNTGAAAGGGTVGWICTTAGATATWKTFGTIAA